MLHASQGHHMEQIQTGRAESRTHEPWRSLRSAVRRAEPSAAAVQEQRHDCPKLRNAPEAASPAASPTVNGPSRVAVLHPRSRRVRCECGRIARHRARACQWSVPSKRSKGPWELPSPLTKVPPRRTVRNLEPHVCCALACIEPACH